MDQKQWYVNEAYMRNVLKIKTLDDENFERLSKSKRYKKYISNICNYNILSNDRYANEFFFTKMALRDENETSDYITRLLFLGE